MRRPALCFLLAGVISILSCTILRAQSPVAGSEPGPECSVLGTADAPPSDHLGPRIGIQQEFGDGLGWRNGFTRLEGFIPILQVPRQSVLFADVRGLEFDDVRLWQFDGGAGYRAYSDFLDRIVGVNGFYDYRDTGSNSFHQFGLGAELLGDCWDLRANLYIPFGPQHHLIADTPAGTGAEFQGMSILIPNQTQTLVAVRGFNLEVGRSVPFLERFDPRAYLGFYHYDAEGGKTANGVRGRFTARLTERLLVQAQVQNDAVFQTTASAGLVWTFGGPSGWLQCRRTLPERLDEPIVREDSVVVQTQVKVGAETAIDPATGQPFVVKHVEADAAAGGNGSFEHPYQTLSQLQAGSGPGQILFVQNGLYPGGITLQPGQRLLGDGTVHLIVARQGKFALPILVPGATPTITAFDQTATGGFYPGSPTAVIMASNTEVSGLSFAVPGFGGPRLNIAADGITGAIDVNHNRLTSFVGLSNINGPVSLTNNSSFAPDSEGTVYVNKITGTVTFSRNTIDTTFNTFLTDISGPLIYTDNTIRFFGVRTALTFDGVSSTWLVQNNVFNGTTALDSVPAVSITGASGSLSLNLIGNTSNTGYGVSKLQFYANGNTGPIVNDGSAKQVSTPLP
jgi:hypothetical protein